MPRFFYRTWFHTLLIIVVMTGVYWLSAILAGNVRPHDNVYFDALANSFLRGDLEVFNPSYGSFPATILPLFFDVFFVWVVSSTLWSFQRLAFIDLFPVKPDNHCALCGRCVMGKALDP